MIKATVNREYNLLHLAFKGRIGQNEFIQLERMLPSVFRCLGADFILMTDLSEVEEIEFACTGLIGALMEHIVEAGLGQVIRVIPDSSKDIGFAILEAFHYPAMLPVRVYADLEEAKQNLTVRSGHIYEIAEEESCEEYIEAGFRNNPASASV